MCSNCSRQEFLEEIEELSADERYEFAAGTLEGIYKWVEESGHATDNQKKAVAIAGHGHMRLRGLFSFRFERFTLKRSADRFYPCAQ